MSSRTARHPSACGFAARADNPTTMSYSRDEDHDPTSALPAHIDALVETLRLLVPAAIRDGDVEAIHQARVSTRRLKAAMDLLAPVLDAEHVKHHRKRFEKTLRKLRRRLGPLRDLDVMSGHLNELPKTPARKVAIQWLNARLRGDRESCGAEALEDVHPNVVLSKLGAWWGLRGDIVEACEAADELLAQSVHEQLDDFAREADRLVSSKPSAQDNGQEGPVDPHAIRIAGKSLRYTLEMALAAGHKIPGEVMKSFKKMQEALGLWHDYVVLTERMLAMSSDAQLGHHDAATQRQILGLSQVTLRRAEKHLGKFAELWKTRGLALSAAIRSVFALTRDVAAPPANSPQTDLGPAGSTETPPASTDPTVVPPAA